MFNLKSYILGMICMALLTLLDKPLMALLEKYKTVSSKK